MEFNNVIEHIQTAVHPLKVKKDILSNRALEALVGRLEPNPFLLEDDDYKPKPVILRPTPTFRSLDFSTGNGYPKFTDKGVELTNDFLMVDTLRDKIESVLAKGYAITYDWQKSDDRGTTINVDLVSDQENRFSVSVTDRSSTLGSLKRLVKEAELNQKAFPKRRIGNHFKTSVSDLEKRIGDRQSQWISQDAKLTIHKKDNLGKIVATAEYTRDGELEVSITERFPVDPIERRTAIQRAESYINQGRFRDYRERHPEFKDAVKLAAAGRDIRTIKRPATAEEETSFMQELVTARVDTKRTEQDYREQSANFKFSGDFHNIGRIYWIKNESRPWHQQS